MIKSRTGESCRTSPWSAPSAPVIVKRAASQDGKNRGFLNGFHAGHRYLRLPNVTQGTLLPKGPPPIPFSLLQARNTKTNQIKQTQAEQTLLRRVCVRTRFDWLTAAIAPFNDSKPSRMSPGVSNISRCSGYSIGDVRRRDAATAGGRL